MLSNLGLVRLDWKGRETVLMGIDNGTATLYLGTMQIAEAAAPQLTKVKMTKKMAKSARLYEPRF